VARAFTSDAVVEYPLAEPGRYLTVDATALSSHCGGNVPPTGRAEHISNLWVFPTNEANTVFVQYSTTSDSVSTQGTSPAEHLSLLEMRGDRLVGRGQDRHAHPGRASDDDGTEHGKTP